VFDATKEFLLGPFTSTGGYDWWKLKTNPGNETLPSELRVVGYSFTFHAGARPATGDDLPGANLGLPPLHNHHSGINFENGINFNQAGDYQCAGQVDGFECMDHDLGSLGYVDVIASSISFAEVLVNDVRPAHSDPLTWYFNFSLSYEQPQGAARKHLRSVGQILLDHAGSADAWALTVDAPVDRDSFMLIESSWPSDFLIITDKRISRSHTHSEHALYGFLIAASAADLGVDAPPFYSPTGCDLVDTAAAGFASADEMLDALIRRCPECFSWQPSSTLQPSGTRLLCAMNASYAYVGEYAYDRQSYFECAGERLNVHAGEVYTHLAFFGPRPEKFNPIGPMPTVSSPMADEKKAAIHHQWLLWFEDQGYGNNYVMQTPPLLTNRLNKTRTFDSEKCAQFPVMRAPTRRTATQTHV